VSRENQLWGLLHDGAEAYVGDLSRPIKTATEFRSIWKPFEARVQLVIAMRFNLEWPRPAEISEVDFRMLATEQRDLMGLAPAPWCTDGVVPFAEHIKADGDFRLVEEEFLDRFWDLMNEAAVSNSEAAETAQS